ncbi:MAG TPA: hypothetical protein VN667_03300 [Burkholderiales bacterium]|nr:hypothetical protein [Burkholderiales bacterium]
MNDIALKDRKAAGPAEKAQDEQAPLGSHPSSEELLDAAVEETFPASDPPAIGAGVRAAKKEPDEVVPQPSQAGSRDPFPWPRGPRR